MTKTYYLPMFSRLEPCQPWRGGRIVDTDLLTLEEAAREACRHSGQDVSVNDFLRAAARGEITLRAIVHASAKVEKFDGGIFCNQGEAAENTVPKGAIPTLPLVACQQLANVGSARWRTFDGFEIVDGVRCRFTVATLADGEPDFETVTADCRVIGFDVHALADAFAGERADVDDKITERLKPIPKKLLQSQRIIQTLQEMGIDPNAMPPFVPGQRGHKIVVWEKVKHEVAVFVSQEAFNSAWKRMLSSGELKAAAAI